MKIIQTIPTQKTIRCPDRTIPMVSTVAIPITTEEDTSSFTYQDGIKVIEVTSATLRYDYQLTSAFGAALTNTTPLVATLSESGRLSGIANGIARVLAVGDYTTAIRLDMGEVLGQSFFSFGGFQSNHPYGIVSQELLDMLDEGGTLPLFSSIDHSAASYVKSTTCWIDFYQLNGLAVSFALNGNNWFQNNSPSLITPRHAVNVRHHGVAVKDLSKVRFLANDGQIHTRTVIGVSDPITNGGLSDDLVLLTLSSDLPATVVPFEVAGEWMRTQLGQIGDNSWEFTSGSYGFSVNQNFQAAVVMFGRGISKYNMSKVGGHFLSIAFNCGSAATSTANTQLDNYVDFTLNVYGGDSGKPLFVRHDGKSVIASLFTGVSFGPFIGAENGQVVNDMILSADTDAGVSTGYTVSIVSNPS